MATHGPLKTLIYHSDFQSNGELRTLRIRDPDLQRGIWQMNIRSFSWTEQETTNRLQQVACNWYSDFVPVGEGHLRYTYAPLELMQCARKYDGRLQFSDPARWIELNNISSELQFRISDARTSTPLASKDGDFICFFTLRRIR